MGVVARLAALLLAVLAAVSLGTVPARAQDVSVSPDIGPPGATFRFSTGGFAPNEVVRVVYRTPSGRVIRFADSAGFDINLFADSAGRVTWSYTSSPDAESGVYIAEASNLGERVQRQLGFVIQAGALPQETLPPAPQGSVVVRPKVGPPGQLFVFRASGFKPTERVGIWLHSPDGSISTLTLDLSGRAVFFADRNGDLQWTVGTRADTPEGRYVAVAAGTVSGEVRIADLIVDRRAGQSAPEPTDNAFVTPVSGPPGTSFAFTATGFLPLEGIEIWIHRPDGSIATISADGADVQADRAGTARWSVTAGPGLTAGVYAMVAEGIISTQVRVVRFEVRP